MLAAVASAITVGLAIAANASLHGWPGMASDALSRLLGQHINTRSSSQALASCEQLQFAAAMAFVT